jgi:hypothetical protein
VGSRDDSIRTRHRKASSKLQDNRLLTKRTVTVVVHLQCANTCATNVKDRFDPGAITS